MCIFSLDYLVNKWLNDYKSGPPHFKACSSVSAAFYSPKVEVPEVPTDQVHIIAINAVLKSTVCRGWVKCL